MTKWILLLLFFPKITTGQVSSDILYYENDRLVYRSDPEGNRIPDFSHAGYKGGGVPLPDVPVKATVEAEAGDDTRRIQAAINSVSRMTPDENGFRGAVLLKPGNYTITDNLFIHTSGVVLRGSGNGNNPDENSILNISKNVQGTVLQIGNEEAAWYRAEGPVVNITSEFVPVGSRSFDVEDASVFSPGENVVIRHFSTPEWIEAVNGGGTAGSAAWEPHYLDLFYNRNITRISGNTVTVDAPVFNHLDRHLSQSVIYTPVRRHLVTQAGVERLRMVIESAHPTADNHAENAIFFRGVEDGWAREVTVFHFRVTGFGTHTSRRITIADSWALEPHSPVTGERRYNFTAHHFSNNILFTNVVASDSRRGFVSNGTSVASGIVFHNSRSVRALNSSEGHQRWSQGLLYDSITFEDAQHHNVLSLYNRGDLGSSHGWAAVHSVAWNVDAGDKSIFIQKPPTAQNYGIGNQGHVTGNGIFEHPEGYIEGTGQTPHPASLYQAQLEDRLAHGVPPDAPARLTVSNETENRLVLNWLHASTTDTEYLIERSGDNGDTYQQIAVTATNETSFSDLDVSDQIYYYRVRAFDGNRTSAYSNSAKKRPKFNSNILPDVTLAAPSPNSVFAIEGSPDEDLHFEWNLSGNSEEISYSWYLDEQQGDFSDPLLIVEPVEENRIDITFSDIDRAFDHFGIAVGDTLHAKWIVKATKLGFEKRANDSHPILLIRKSPLDYTDGEDIYAILDQNYPNPFNPSTTIRYHLSEPSNVRLEIYDLQGVKVATLDSGPKSRGMHTFYFDASNLASGVYLYRLTAEQFVQTRKMVLIK